MSAEITTYTAPRPRDEVIDRLANASRSQGLDVLAGELEATSVWLGEDLASVERELGLVSSKPRDLAERAARHLLERPGKRIRALSVLFTARFGGEAPSSIARDLAQAAELVHAATLLHDDVIDEGTERRGAAAARVVYGNSASVLGGDHLLIAALRKVERTGERRLLIELIEVIQEMINAEALQLEARAAPTPSKPEEIADRIAVYLRVARGKTAALFRWSMRAGATSARLSSDEIVSLGEAGEALGLSFQLVDDAIDLEGDATRAGKDVLADLREGKLTWPILAALSRDPSLAQELDRAKESGSILGLAERVRSLGGVRAARGEAQRFGEQAIVHLRTISDTAARRAYETLVRAALERRS
jgi:octaprenyl-diphosphate synthase